MRPTRRPSVLSVLSVPAMAGLLLVLAACGGNNAGSSTSQSSGSTPSSGTEQSSAATPTAAASSGGGGGSSSDLAALADKLVPPNSTQIIRTDAGDGFFIGYNSTDSLDSLKSFYQSAITNAGMTIISTTTAADGVAFIFTKGSDSSFGGSVSLGPGSDTGTTGVTITLAKS